MSPDLLRWPVIHVSNIKIEDEIHVKPKEVELSVL